MPDHPLDNQPGLAGRTAGHDRLAIPDAGRRWVVELDRRRRPAAVALEKGPMTASQDLGDPLHVAASVAVYETEICLVVVVDDRIGIIPATTGPYHEVRREPSRIGHHLASGAILFPDGEAQVRDAPREP
jgi:hypothetical protein